MIDFTDCKEVFNRYGGSEKKKTLIYNGKKYLVKFPDPIREKNKNISYINNAFSEYVGSHIFELVGMEVQRTLLGKYRYLGREKIVCACLDFTDSTHVLYEFEQLLLSTNPDKKIKTELLDVLNVIEECESQFSIKDVKHFFWDMFVIDGLIGNTDRHNGNWGFLMNEENGDITLAPVYDCGSCLSPLYEDEDIKKFDKVLLKNMAMNCYSCFKVDGKRIPYMSYIRGKENKDCNEAIIRIFPCIDMDKICCFIDEIECISEERKGFYKEILKIRYEVIKGTYDNLMYE